MFQKEKNNIFCPQNTYKVAFTDYMCWPFIDKPLSDKFIFATISLYINKCILMTLNNGISHDETFEFN